MALLPYYAIPFSIMVCREISNLLVTGRCVSATFEAQAAIRLAPSAGAMGQAAGVAAAMTALGNGYVDALDIPKLQQRLRDQGAYLEE